VWKELVKFFTSLFEGLDLRRRWSLIVGTVIVAVLVTVVFEYCTAWNYYRSLENKVSFLKELHALAKDDIAASPELFRIYRETAGEVGARRVRPLTLPTFTPSVTSRKFVSGSLFWLVMMFAALRGTFGQETSIKVIGVVFMGVVALLFGCLGTLIPTICNPLVNYLGFPIVQIRTLWLLGRGTKKARDS